MTTNQPPVPQSFAEFWPYYMAAHQDQRNRAVHYLGSVGGIVALLGALVSGNPWLLLVGILFGYACAWFGHFSFEHKKPATSVKPWWSFLGDWRMFWMKLTGREGEAVALGQGLPDIVEMVRARR